MDKRQRIMAAIAGELPDRVPLALWLPLREEETDPAKNAARARTFAEDWDMDLIVTVNGGAYSSEDYKPPDFTQVGGLTYITDPEDWRAIGELSVNQGALAREQDSLKQLLDAAGGVPVVFRIVSPLATACRLAPHLAEDVRRGGGGAVKEALTAITETTCALVQRVIELGADGIFFEAPLADYELCSEPFYREYGAPYDLAVLSASSGWCNVVHGGVTDCMFPRLRKYPAQIFSWDASQSLPELAEAQRLSGKCCMAGLSRRHLEFGLRNEVEHDLYQAFLATGRRRLILSAGAPADPHPAMADFFRKARQDVESCFQ